MRASGAGLNTVPIAVSDHALIRLLERTGGFDPEPLRQSIADRLARAHAAAKAIRAEKYSIVLDGLAYVVVHGVVVTVMKDDKDGRMVR